MVGYYGPALRCHPHIPEYDWFPTFLTVFSLSVDTFFPCRDSRVILVADVCYSEELPEVDLVSLIEEQIPRYVLRADTLTDFAGYDNSDWIRTPVLPADTPLPLSPELIDETLKYFGE